MEVVSVRVRMEISPLIMGRVQEEHMSYDREIDSSREAGVGPAAGLQINEKGAQYPGGGKTESDWKEAAPGIIYYWPTCSHTHKHNTTKLWVRVLARIKN